ncbi:distal tail protein Dit [Leuconostoc pseudomesenteroides]|uniref:distal tail protein Dit n=1 Tax=Leuconostoc pseudomesenteroides TaxID=33968 RepID=UPI00403D5E53
MAKGILTYKGKTSDYFGMRLLANYDLEQPEYDYNSVEVPGRDGVLLINNGRYKAIKREYEFRVLLVRSRWPTIEKQLTDISGWLNATQGFQPLTFDAEPDYIYKAAVTEGQKFTRLTPSVATGSVALTINPIKYLVSDQNAIQVVNNSTVSNSGNVTAQPKITITGSGSGIFKFGKSTFQVKNVDGGLIVNSELQTVTTLSGFPAYAQVVTPILPVLNIGNNTVVVPGGFTVSIVPNSGVLV